MPNTIPATGEAMPATAETPNDELRRLSWRIADLLNDMPRIDYVGIRASRNGAHAVFTGFDVPMGDETPAEHLFREWQACRGSIRGEDTPEVEKQKLDHYGRLRDRVSVIHPMTVRDLVLMLYVETSAGVDDYGDDFMTHVFGLAGLTNENVARGA